MPIRADMKSLLEIARIDHWFKNVFMLLGMVLAFFYRPETAKGVGVWTAALGFLATCLVASSYYVLNEILDAPTDANHPIKRNRPIPSGRVRIAPAYALWLALAAAGLALAWSLNRQFFIAAACLWGMSLIYNVPPIRTKDVPFLDVLSESLNNPLRLALGWFLTGVTLIPPLSLMISYWMAGAFFMSAKRFAEYRWIGNPEQAGAYRASFRYYTENRLLTCMVFYTAASALFLGIFIVRYRLELIFGAPLITAFFAKYFHVALKPDSAAQYPELLHKEKSLMALLVLCLAAFVLLMFTRIELLYDLFNVHPSEFPPLWNI